ncbi:MAG: YhcH/YjgK/YiaL family protein [Prevotella sp.]|jgi:YhcH/YjgK/YiaL family protein|nr:YhcH/YjgK/YiaL family protein [Prevotella sp.]MCI2079929.1 YhcH/YjgK/YiaL family protein [Prevotella sp.]MCI2101755.1 YhcH/YjgK/YiaL family protein [Prevotella sp.]HCN53679.1 YhcH/YjgK/YiaL family protein [Prevotella sp.]
MIIDKIENLEKYVSLNPLLKDVVEFIKANDLSKLEPGRHDIKGDDLFVNVQKRPAKTREEATLEYHRQMIDIQVPIKGVETYGYTPLADLPVSSFDESSDMGLVPGVAAQNYVTCPEGMFAIFFPQDGHAPLIGEGELFKAIFKVKA